jgi:hypothetical protein
MLLNRLTFWSDTALLRAKYKGERWTQLYAELHVINTKPWISTGAGGTAPLFLINISEEPATPPSTFTLQQDKSIFLWYSGQHNKHFKADESKTA